ncbi:YcnI family copper-binding membrane protein [Parafrankia elaeagni]|uniref:YcnI family copper-binding membrane protein n=1 Tax=Parafrankia elaeagni TaxID=222534 RepID=UPI00037984FD|nr:YcnI family protein [Parafrankia elaeagni]
MPRTIRAAARLRRGALCTLAAAAGTVALALPASAHVTVSPQEATAGGYATLMFKVPTESDSASTTGLDVQFPADTPIASVTVQPKPGWTYQVTRGAPSRPLTAHGTQINEVVTQITWTAQDGGGIRPGEFDTFGISAGPLPEDADQVVFKALQTYSDGEIVRWIDVAGPGGDEPEHPAPAITLTAADEEGAGAGGDNAADEASTSAGAGTGSGQPAAVGSESDGTARALGITGLVLGLLGLGAGAFALISTRRRA